MAGKNAKAEGTQLTQSELDDLAGSLDIQYAVLDNITDGHTFYQAAITLCNKGNTELRFGNWAIIFSHMRMIEPSKLPCDDGIMLAEGLQLFHLNGCLFRLQPTAEFVTLKRGQAMTIPFKAQYYSVARSDILPNWYLTAQDLEPRVIACTAGETLDFVAPFDTVNKWKRFDYILNSNSKRRYDFYDPFTPQVRFEKNEVTDVKKAGQLVIPTPASITVNDTAPPLKMDRKQWVVCYDPAFKEQAEYLADRLGAQVFEEGSHSIPTAKKVLLVRKEVSVHLSGTPVVQEAYQLKTSGNSQQVEIFAGDGAGMFWGIQTLLSLACDGNLPEVQIEDAPRYPYRGMHVDVSRNFHSKDCILRLLEAMGRYKLNKFHFHLTDDEGWRLEIPGLPELTQVGSKRCHTSSADDDALPPLLGSGPHTSSSGTGFFTVDEYRHILQFATQRHIEIIPEIDMPGHCHAAIKAMRVRYKKLKVMGKVEAAEEFLLSDLSACSSTSSQHQSVQMFSENSLNPGLASTFKFIRKVMQELKEMHRDICPLRLFHFGGDEVPYDAWELSPACQALVESGQVESSKDLMEYFVVKVAEIAADQGLEVGAWQDGVVHKCEPPFPREKFPNKNVSVYAWKNVWETGMAWDMHKLANAGYQVVLSPGTHLYFDHPQEPDPEERGLYWACRYTDTHKVFKFAPANMISNADVRLTGEPFSYKEQKAMLSDEDYTPLQKPENIIGLQGQLWTELVRTSEQFDAMIFPRLLALAERAWHEASWEGQHGEGGHQTEMRENWCCFANSLGYRELAVLDRLGVSYYLPPPGARIQNEKWLEVNCQIPGLPIQYSTDNGAKWKLYNQPVEISQAEDLIILRTCSTDGCRHSRVIKVHPFGDPPNSQDNL